MLISFLGTNGWFPSDTGQTICTSIETEDELVFLDAGSGLSRLAGEKLQKPATILLSHLHLDHTVGLHLLQAIGFSALNVVAGENSGVLKGLYQPFAAPAPKATVFEGKTSFSKKPFLLNHTVPNFGWRIELEGKKIAYTGDTGGSDNLDRLAKNADVLISECAVPRKGMEWFHLSPEEAAEVAERNGVESLFLTHFSAALFTSLALRKKAEETARKTFRKTTFAFDGLLETL